MRKGYHAQMPGKRFSSANNRPEEGIWGKISTPRWLEKDVLQLTPNQKKAYGEGLPRPDGWKRFPSANNRPEEGIWGRVTTPRWLEKRFSSANNRPEECIWGRITTPRWLEKDFLQLTTDQKKAYGEGLPRPDGWQKIFFS